MATDPVLCMAIDHIHGYKTYSNAAHRPPLTIADRIIEVIMQTHIAIALALGAVTISGCAKKTPPANVSQMQPPVDGTEVALDTEAEALARLQADLAASAGADRVLFELDSSTLTPVARQILAGQISWLRRHPEVSFTIEGHCDERGTREYNFALGNRRAAAVAAFLTAEGISPSRLRTVSFGKERPEAPDSDELAYAKNRRAVSIVVNSAGR
jgi:peptidoglycan-associated lipoprotein